MPAKVEWKVKEKEYDGHICYDIYDGNIYITTVEDKDTANLISASHNLLESCEE